MQFERLQIDSEIINYVGRALGELRANEVYHSKYSEAVHAHYEELGVENLTAEEQGELRVRLFKDVFSVAKQLHEMYPDGNIQHASAKYWLNFDTDEEAAETCISLRHAMDFHGYGGDGLTALDEAPVLFRTHYAEGYKIDSNEFELLDAHETLSGLLVAVTSEQ